MLRLIKKLKLIKKTKRIVSVMLVLTGPVVFAYIPSSKMILDKLIENNTTGPILYEQEVIVSGVGTTATLKETWLVENESVMTLVVQGEKDLKDKIQFLVQYNGKRRFASISFIKGNDSVTADFFEPIFFIKSQQKLVPYIISTGVVGSDLQNSSNFQKQKDLFIHTPEPFVRLGRTAGVVAYIISGSTGLETKLPGLWIEQDQFLLRKIRNSKKTEMSVEKWGNYSRGWKLPKERSFAWDDKTAAIKLLDAKIPQANAKSLLTKTQEVRSSEYDNSKEKALIEEFYLKLR